MSYAQPWDSAREAVFFNQNDVVNTMWMVDSGLVRFRVLAPDGREVVSAFSGVGRCFGDVEVFSQQPSSVSAIASTKCAGWKMSTASALEAIACVPAFAQLMLTTLARSARVTHLMYQHALILTAPERLALVLLNLANEETGPDGAKSFVVSATQDMLSQIVGSSRQFVSKHIGQWTALGWIEPKYGKLHLRDSLSLGSVVQRGVSTQALKDQLS